MAFKLNRTDTTGIRLFCCNSISLCIKYTDTQKERADISGNRIFTGKDNNADNSARCKCTDNNHRGGHLAFAGTKNGIHRQ